MSPDDVLSTVVSYFTKRRDDLRDYYHSRKNDACITNKVKEHNRKWYQSNKSRIAALQRCKYSNNPEYRQWCQRYQELYAQRQRKVTSNERNLGRPRKYNIASSC